MIDIYQNMRTALDTEIAGIESTKNALNQNTVRVVELLFGVEGKVVFTGVGKSGHIGRKLAASFASLGTRATFVHSTESLHGDMGEIAEQDIVLLLSNSGTTQEVLAMLPSLRKIGCKLIAFTSNPESVLAKSCDYVLSYTYQTEADTLGLAPTTSATTMLALGDSIAVTLSKMKNFTADNFHLYHPGGALGEKLAQG
ncbi:KpsF/GutQ family sugar-phosphate isomerase [Streptococcus ovis]|uniref:KpsF/GutQ family sugar-phosphate isomerase n=1 Tax=Streptococcus ovis TaxID=82806 RepID=UPI0003663D2F|nr:SIS domain-containing protein [Streptococcus ovis]